MADVLHVGTYLVGASRLKSALHERDVAEAFEHTPVGHGFLADARIGRHHGHAQAVFRVACYVALDASFVLGEVSPYECVVRAVCGLVEELQAERCLRLRCLCHHEQTRCVLVNAMHESHFGVVGVVALQVAQMPSYGVDECACEVAGSRVHHHACLLVYHHQLRVFVHHVERYVLCHDACVVARTVEHQCHHIIGAHLVVALHGALVYVYEACVGSFLYAVARRVGQLLAHELVNALRLLTRVGYKAEVLVELTGLVVVFDWGCEDIFFYHILVFRRRLSRTKPV